MTETSSNDYVGIYGKYTITNEDKKEVFKYRISLLISAISYTLGLSQWIFLGPSYAWLWLIPMSISLGLALKWIHIYIKMLHKALQVLLIIGSLSILVLFLSNKSGEVLSNLVSQPHLIVIFGPFFAALTGLGFKEFFCFRRPEAIGVTLLIPIGLLLHFLRIFDPQIIMIILYISSILLLILSLRKFGMDEASDIGDKSVFDYLNNKVNIRSSQL